MKDLAVKNSLEEISIYRKFPNYKMIVPGIALLLLPFITKKIDNSNSLLICVGLGLYCFFHQLYAYKNRKKVILKINKEGLWYDGVWYNRNAFYAWRDIKSIKFKRDKKTFFNLDTINVYPTTTWFPFLIAVWNLDATINDLYKEIMRFYNKIT